MDASLVSMLRLILILALVGFGIWLLFRYVPMPQIWRTIITVVIVVIVLWYLITMLAGSGGGHIRFAVQQLAGRIA